MPTHRPFWQTSQARCLSGSLIADFRGDLFLTTKAGGAHNYGAVFEIAKTAAGYAGMPILLASFGQSEVAPVAV